MEKRAGSATLDGRAAVYAVLEGRARGKAPRGVNELKAHSKRRMSSSTASTHAAQIMGKIHDKEQAVHVTLLAAHAP